MSLSPDAEQRDDRALIRAHLDGDSDAFAVLFTRHRDRLWAVALRTTGDPEDAADALQDALISAFRRADSYREEAAVTTWLHRIVVNACLDRLRRKNVRRADPLPEREEELPDRLRVGEGSADPADLVEAHERRALVARALATLAPDQRAALVLVDLQGYSVDEAARILEVPPGTVKSRCSRGRAKLLPLLESLRSHPARPISGNRTDATRVPSAETDLSGGEQ